MNPTERITNKATVKFPGLPTYYLWSLYVLSTTFFLVPHFVMLIAKKIIAYCLFLYTTASIFLQFLFLYFYIY